ncbi:hypothetical protein LTR66_012624 [Elasticomyces elasticus]|nr:hypothetical protein LTR66_012624 [Elasticomyces elasticus]
MEPELVHTLPNWSAATDFIASSLPHSNGSARLRDSLFLTSGRQPYGTVTELRRGFEARMSLQLESEDYRGVVDVWALPDRTGEGVFFLFSGPAHSTLNWVSFNEMVVEADYGPENCLLDVENRTLCAALSTEGCFLQVTESGVRIVSSVLERHRDDLRIDCPPGEVIVRAAIHTRASTVVIIVRRGSETFLHHCTYTINVAGITWRQHGEPIAIRHEPVCLALCSNGRLVFAVVGTSSATIQVINLTPERGPVQSLEQRVATADDAAVICESIVHFVDDDPWYPTITPVQRSDGSSIMDSQNIVSTFHQKRPRASSLLLCGLRSGRLLVVELRWAVDSDTECDLIALGNVKELDFGHTAVRLVRDIEDPYSALASCGSDFCRITWDRTGLDGISVQSVWLTDNARPAYKQAPVSAATRVPHVDSLGHCRLTYAFVIVSDETCIVAQLDEEIKAVPRYIPVEGTPCRLIYSSQLRCLVVASSVTEIVLSPANGSSAPAKERRRIRPAIEFKPAGDEDWSYTEYMQPGEQVYALMPWAYAEAQSRKKYFFIVVASGITDSSGRESGSVSFLQPKAESVGGRIVDVKLGKRTSFSAPVYAIAPYLELGYVACSGSSLVVYRFSPDEKRWVKLCEHRLASAGVCVTASPPFIQVTTNADSLLVFELLTTDTTALPTANPSGNGTSSKHTLRPVGMDSVQRYGMHHLPIFLSPEPPPPQPQPRTDTTAEDPLNQLPNPNTTTTTTLQETPSFTLLTTKSATLTGLLHPSPTTPTSPRPTPNTTPTLFTAHTPRSLTRLRRADARPPWKPRSVPGVLDDRIIGVASDGTVVGVAVLEEALWRRLSWVVRLCKRAGLAGSGVGRGGAGGFGRRYGGGDLGEGDHDYYDEVDDVRDLPMGFFGQAASDLPDYRGGNAAASASWPQQRRQQVHPDALHIDADILQRLLDVGNSSSPSTTNSDSSSSSTNESGPASLLRTILLRAAKQADPLGRYLAAHLEQESRMELLEEVVGVVREVCGRWV